MYDILFQAWKKEKENTIIQPLPKSFYTDISDYLKRIQREKRMLDERSIKGNLVSKEEKNVNIMIGDLLQTRYNKILQAMMRGNSVPTATLTREETRLYTSISSQDDSFQEFSRGLLQGWIKKKKQLKLMVVRILQEIPEIIGADMKVYGPFKPEDTATLPKENARNLIKQGAAMEVEIP